MGPFLVSSRRYFNDESCGIKSDSADYALWLVVGGPLCRNIMILPRIYDAIESASVKSSRNTGAIESNPSQKDIKTAADTLWRKTKFPKEDDWVFSGLYCRRIQRSINDVFDEDSWRKWRDGIKRQLNKKRNSVTQMVKDEYIGKKKR